MGLVGAAMFLGVTVYKAWELCEGVWLVHRQHQILRSCQPTQGTILDVRAGPVTRPAWPLRIVDLIVPRHIVAVSYRYQVNGNEHASGTVDPARENPEWSPPSPSRFHPLRCENLEWTGQVGPPGVEWAWGGGTWAEKWATAYTRGQTCRVWYDPRDPAQAFLVRDHCFGPYVQIGVGCFWLWFVSGILAWTLGVQVWDGPTPVRWVTISAGCFLLLNTLVVLISCWALWHYHSCAHQPLTQAGADLFFAWVGTLIMALGNGTLLHSVARMVWLGRSVPTQ